MWIEDADVCATKRTKKEEQQECNCIYFICNWIDLINYRSLLYRTPEDVPELLIHFASDCLCCTNEMHNRHITMIFSRSKLPFIRAPQTNYTGQKTKDEKPHTWMCNDLGRFVCRIYACNHFRKKGVTLPDVIHLINFFVAHIAMVQLFTFIFFSFSFIISTFSFVWPSDKRHSQTRWIECIAERIKNKMKIHAESSLCGILAVNVLTVNQLACKMRRMWERDKSEREMGIYKANFK